MQPWTGFLSGCSMLCSWKGYPIFSCSNSCRIFLEENNAFHHFCCQWKRMFTWELLAAVLCKGCAGGGITGTGWELPTGSSVTIKGTVYPAAMEYVQHGPQCQVVHVAQHEPGPTQVKCYVDQQLLSAQWSSSQGHYAGQKVRRSGWPWLSC